MAATIKRLEKPIDNNLVEVVESLLADVKAGNVTDIVVVGNHVADGCFFRSSVFADRWRLLGALEYAKDGIHHN